jgi:hypothetical protein
MSDDAAGPSLTARLLAAQRAMPGVPRTGTNAAQGWQYVEASRLVPVAREALVGAGLAAYLAVDPTMSTDRLLAASLVVACDTGTLRLPAHWPIERPGPQGLRAAHTYALKQSLMDLLLVGDPDDPETTAGAPHPDPDPDTIPAPGQAYMRAMTRLRDAGMSREQASTWTATTVGRTPTRQDPVTVAEMLLLDEAIDKISR